jgi:hypothetical protein
MIIQQVQRDLLQRPGGGVDRGEQVNAVAVVGDHPRDAAHLPFHLAQPGQVVGFAVAVSRRRGDRGR